MLLLLLNLASNCMAQQSVPVPSLSSPQSQQAIQQNLDDKFSIRGGTFTGKVFIGTMTIQNTLQCQNTSANCICFSDGSCQNVAAGTGAAFWNASGANIYNTNSGNVGINQTSPQTKLDVLGTIRAQSQAFSSPANGTGLEMYYDASLGQGVINPYDRTSSVYKPMLYSGNPAAFSTNGTELFRLSGNQIVMSNANTTITTNASTAVSFSSHTAFRYNEYWLDPATAAFDMYEVHGGPSSGIDVYGLRDGQRPGLTLHPTKGVLPTVASGNALTEFTVYVTTDEATNLERFSWSALPAPQVRFSHEVGGNKTRSDVVWGDDTPDGNNCWAPGNCVQVGKERYLSFQAARWNQSKPIDLEYSHLRFDFDSQAGNPGTYFVARSTGFFQVNVPSYSSMTWTVAGVPYMHLNANGGNAQAQLGVGTTSPVSTLEVNGNAQFGSGVTKSTFSTAGSLTLDPSATITIPKLSSNTIVGLDSSTSTVSVPQMGKGGLIIGNGVGVFPSTGTLTASANMAITNAAGKVTVDTIQAIQTTSQPQFAGLNIGGNSASTSGSIELDDNSNTNKICGGISLAGCYTFRDPSLGYSVFNNTSFGYIFKVAGSESFRLSTTAGHPEYTGTAPTISSCGAVPNGSVVGNDHVGIITIGGGVVTACTLNFSANWTNTAVCNVTDSNATIGTAITAASNSAITVGLSSTLGGGTLYYHCDGYR